MRTRPTSMRSTRLPRRRLPNSFHHSCRGVSRVVSATGQGSSMTRYSYLSHLQCSKCGERHDATVAQGLCKQCGSPLLARYDLDAIRTDVRRDDVHTRAWELWRYHELLPS